VETQALVHTMLAILINILLLVGDSVLPPEAATEPITLQAPVHTTLLEKSLTKLLNMVLVTNLPPISTLSPQDLAPTMPLALEDMTKFPLLTHSD